MAALNVDAPAGARREPPRLPPGAPRRQPPRLSGRSTYSLYVSAMKVLLPALATAMIILLIAWSHFSPEDALFGTDGIKNPAQQAENLSMINARYSGVDDQNQPFTVTADMATQARSDENRIDLQLPGADISMKDGAWLALTAKVGHYDRKAELLDLEGEVNLFHDQGFEMHSEYARIDLKAGTAEGNLPVQGQGPLGILNAEGFKIFDRGARVIFTGKSSMTIYPDAKDDIP